MREDVLQDLFDEPIGQLLVKDQSLHVFGFDPQTEEITRWIPWNEIRSIIESILIEYTKIPYAYGDIQTEAVFDRVRDRYLLMNVGWDNRRRGSMVASSISILLTVSSGSCMTARSRSHP